MVTHYEIFRHHLVTQFPAYGYPLWEPDPANVSTAVEVGDVGFIREGRFYRLFNALLPADDPSHEIFGVPDDHEPLIPAMGNHTIISQLSPCNLCSANVTSKPVSEPLAEG